MAKTYKRKSKKNKTKRVFKSKDFNSNDGMLTSVWGPSAWHYIHTVSFNYPTKPCCPVSYTHLTLPTNREV